ncbi:hypothetical protein GGR42_000440 [Saonia flava]|uniref:Uncharacterized protein n=1 Tax=Saonia flava TaxID=523696 RepID=A0A846QPE7_9FLAO|nr:hypothetical protein [Saonia flava]NJB69978.1 hypothetical protein [Saonia flava]
METLDKQEINEIRDPDNHASILRLERNNKALSQLKRKLASYTCEPQTRSLYERMELLKSQLEVLLQKNKEIIASLKQRGPNMVVDRDRSKEQITEFNEIQKSVNEYVAGIGNHR